MTFHPDVDREVREAAQYYETQSVGLGNELLSEVERALDQISINPQAYQRIHRRVRRKPLWRFPYSIVYAIYQGHIRIVAPAHQKRRPLYWRRRLRGGSEQGGLSKP